MSKSILCHHNVMWYYRICLWSMPTQLTLRIANNSSGLDSTYSADKMITMLVRSKREHQTIAMYLIMITHTFIPNSYILNVRINRCM